MSAKNQDNMARWRCLEVGCNPKLRFHNAQQHKEQTGHRVAKAAVRSEAGKAKQRAHTAAWFGYDRLARDDSGGEHPFSSEALGQW